MCALRFLTALRNSCTGAHDCSRATRSESVIRVTMHEILTPFTLEYLEEIFTHTGVYA